MEIQRVNENQEKILSYLASKERTTGFNDADSNEISVFLGMTRSSTSRHLDTLKQKKLIMIKREGKRVRYIITSAGRDYLKVNSIMEIPVDEVKSLSYEDAKQVQVTLEEIEKVKKEVSDLKDAYEKRLVEFEENVNVKISSFYGRIGEILTLIITAVAMIVFNIQLIGTVEIDFRYPMKAAQTILAIDLPYIVLFSIFILIFHIIIGRGDNGKIKQEDVKRVIVKSLPIIIIVIASLVFIA